MSGSGNRTQTAPSNLWNFSLRELICLMIAIAAGFGWYVQREQNTRKLTFSIFAYEFDAPPALIEVIEDLRIPYKWQGGPGQTIGFGREQIDEHAMPFFLAEADGYETSIVTAYRARIIKELKQRNCTIESPDESFDAADWGFAISYSTAESRGWVSVQLVRTDRESVTVFLSSAEYPR